MSKFIMVFLLSGWTLSTLTAIGSGIIISNYKYFTQKGADWSAFVVMASVMYRWPELNKRTQRSKFVGNVMYVSGNPIIITLASFLYLYISNGHSELQAMVCLGTLGVFWAKYKAYHFVKISGLTKEAVENALLQDGRFHR
jgi:hypothetical protein